MRTAANAAINFRSAKAHSGTASGARPRNCFGRTQFKCIILRTAANAAINFRSAKAHSGTASGARLRGVEIEGGTWYNIEGLIALSDDYSIKDCMNDE